MQLTMKECAVLAFIFFASPAVGTMVNGAPVPIDARNQINRLQANPAIAARAAASSGSSSGGGLMGLIGDIAPFAEDILPMLARREAEATKAGAAPKSSAEQTPAPKVPASPKGATSSTEDADAAKKVVVAHNAALAHVKSVNELSSKLVNDPTARQKLYQIITSVKAAQGNAAAPHATVAPGVSHVLAQRAPDASSTGSSSGGGLMGLIGDIAPFAEDILPMLARREPEPEPAAVDDAAHSKAVAALSSKIATDPSARAKAEKIAHAITAQASATAVKRAPDASSTGSSGGGLMGLIGDIAPFAEDILPMLARREPEPAKAVNDAAHKEAVAALSSKIATDPSARAKAEKIAHAITAQATATAVKRAPAAASSGSSSGGGLMGLIGDIAPFAEDILPMLARREPEPHMG